ncbi:hypothetical protein M153_7720003583, partial [Pseudoloma neurophilia]
MITIFEPPTVTDSQIFDPCKIEKQYLTFFFLIIFLQNTNFMLKLCLMNRSVIILNDLFGKYDNITGNQMNYKNLLLKYRDIPYESTDDFFSVLFQLIRRIYHSKLGTDFFPILCQIKRGQGYKIELLQFFEGNLQFNHLFINHKGIIRAGEVPKTKSGNPMVPYSLLINFSLSYKNECENSLIGFPDLKLCKYLNKIGYFPNQSLETEKYSGYFPMPITLEIKDEKYYYLPDVIYCYSSNNDPIKNNDP